MKHHPPKTPLIIRRLIGPLLLLILAAGLVFVLKGFAHESLRDAEHDYGSFVIGLAILYFAVRLINYFVFDLVFRLRRGAEAPALLREIAALLIFGVGLALLLRFLLAVHLTAVLATSALITAVVGFALQDTLGNLFSGLSLHLEKSLEVGDLVRIGETIGLVEALSWRAIPPPRGRNSRSFRKCQARPDSPSRSISIRTPFRRASSRCSKWRRHPRPGSRPNPSRSAFFPTSGTTRRNTKFVTG